MVAVATRLSHGCAIRANQNVTCWGANTSGQASPPSGTVTQLAAGQARTCGVRTDATIICWGANGAGQALAPGGSFAS